MKKLPILAAAIVLAAVCSVSGAYKVETDDEEYVSDEIFFAPMSTWDKVEPQVINLNKGKIIFYADRENTPERIEYAVMPVNTTDKRVTYKSDDITIAAVDQDGVVTPQNKIGDTFVEIMCGSVKSRMKVSVVRGVEGVAMSQSALTLYADRPAAAQLEALVSPLDATIRDVEWYSSDDSIAHVDKEGLVYPSGVGTADVYAKTVDGGFLTKCTVTVTTWEKRKENIPVTYTEYDYTLDDMVSEQMKAEPTIFTTNAFPASEDDIRYFADPMNLTGGYDKYQFMNLSESNGIDADMLDAYLNGKGILSGTGAVFKSAADNNALSEVYLVIHSCLETGNGTSELANGVEYNGVTVYNMFGIGAIDADPVGGGAKYAYDMGWTSVRKAIEGGAEWISDNYINNMRYSQNTLYKMRWNPDRPAQHQYATDAQWASKQAEQMGAMFEAFPTADYLFDIPVFEGQDKAEIE